MGIHERYASLAEAVEGLRKALDAAHEENARLRAERLQWQGERESQQAIIQRAIARANAANNAVLEENARLKERLRELGG
jgi:FtsZ-binding cell division protein ZapB